jgi:predicted metal-dependent enzyme (double-stranded beta helix superfamily)
MISSVPNKIATAQPRGREILSQRELAEEVRRIAGRPAEWVSKVRLDPEGRWYERIHVGDRFELWLISWLPGQSTGFHDHGRANGAFSVVWGTLDECVVAGAVLPKTLARSRPGPGAAATVRSVTNGVVRAFGPHYIHDVRNTSRDSVAVSVHAYSPPLSAMTRYDLTPGGLVVSATETREDW